MWAKKLKLNLDKTKVFLLQKYTKQVLDCDSALNRVTLTLHEINYTP